MGEVSMTRELPKVREKWVEERSGRVGCQEGRRTKMGERGRMRTERSGLPRRGVGCQGVGGIGGQEEWAVRADERGEERADEEAATAMVGSGLPKRGQAERRGEGRGQEDKKRRQGKVDEKKVRGREERAHSIRNRKLLEFRNSTQKE